MTPRKSFTVFKPAALVLAGVLAGTVFAETFRPAAALAQDGKTLPPERVLNSAAMTQQIAESMRQVNERLARIEASLNGGLKVRVVEMPASKDTSK